MNSNGTHIIDLLWKPNSLKTAFGFVGSLMVTSAVLQLSLVSQREWSSLFSRASHISEKCVAAPARRLSFSIREALSSPPDLRRVSLMTQSSDMSMSEEALDKALGSFKRKAE
jgi:hypothetical protein